MKVQEQPFVVLLKLLERPRELVTREELRLAIWPADTFVDFDTGLNTVVKRLREVLRDSVEAPVFIETVPKLGYRFIAPVQRFERDAVALADSPIERRNSATIKWSVASALLLVLAAIAAYFWTRPLPPPIVMGYTQITDDGTAKVSLLGYSFLVTDGGRIYFTHAVSGIDLAFAQVSATGGETVPIPTSFPTLVADISPDHGQLLIISIGTQSAEWPLWMFPTLGGSGQRIGNSLGHAGTWSPDGQEIVYANGLDLLATPVHGGESRTIVRLPGGASWIRYSPDGSRLRFTVKDVNTNSQSLWEVQADGNNLVPLLGGWHNPPNECCGNWTPDGKYFLFQSTRAGKTGIYAIAERGGLFRKVRRDPVLLTAGPLNYYSPLPSLDGRKIYVVGSQPRGELQRYDSRAGLLVPLLPGLSAEGLDFSRDGKWVAYVTFPEGTLWRSKVDGSERMQLTSPPLSVFLPRWSPDGKRIAFSASVPGKLHRLYWVSAEGGAPEALTSGEHDEGDVGWSADGNQLVFGSMGGVDFTTFGIRLFDVKTHQVSSIANSAGLYSSRWSPDGKYIAALNLTDDLVLFDVVTQKWQELPRIDVGYPNWSHDSKYLYFDGGGKSAPLAFYRFRITDHKLEPLFNMASLGRAGTFQWTGLAPDDSPLFLRDIGREEIYALDWKVP